MCPVIRWFSFSVLLGSWGLELICCRYRDSLRPGILELSRPRLPETRNFGVVETETWRDWAKVVETETFSRVSLYSGINCPVLWYLCPVLWYCVRFCDIWVCKKIHELLGTCNGHQCKMLYILYGIYVRKSGSWSFLLQLSYMSVRGATRNFL